MVSRENPFIFVKPLIQGARGEVKIEPNVSHHCVDLPSVSNFQYPDQSIFVKLEYGNTKNRLYIQGPN